MIFGNFFMFKSFYEFFYIWNGLVSFNLLFPFSIDLIVYHRLDNSVLTEFSCEFPAQMISLRQANLLSFKANQKQESLVNFWIFHNVVFFEVGYVATPLFLVLELFRHNRKVLVFLFYLYQLFISIFFVILIGITLEIDFVIIILFPNKVLYFVLEIWKCLFVLAQILSLNF